jgi:hypothetical protein
MVNGKKKYNTSPISGVLPPPAGFELELILYDMICLLLGKSDPIFLFL